MALQTSGSIAISEIEDEFGGSAPTAISEYYSAAPGVPSSGSIKFSDFYGKSNSVDVLGISPLLQSGTSRIATYTTNAPAGTKAVVVGINRNVNRFKDTQVSSLVFDGTSMTEVLTAERTGAEYNTDSSIWVLNKTYTSSTPISITATYAQDSSANYGKSMMVLFLDRDFNNYTPSSTYANNATSGGSVSLYEGGIAIGVATRNTATEVTTFGSDFWVSNFEPDYYMTYEAPTSNGTGTLNLSGTLTSFGRSVTAIASWERSKFN
jgi:hypothetical protein